MAKKTKPKAKVNDVFMHTTEKKMFIIDSVDTYPKGNLYTMREVSSNNDVNYKRYYENKLMDQCVKAKNTKAVKVLYGKKK